mmetsp:Transcript_44969/g.141568  ORF Transcript_44969/g.141568 Transcript_44969/m.141568 type:complete len:224 (-) Transcript_44969:314-985(-)
MHKTLPCMSGEGTAGRTSVLRAVHGDIFRLDHTLDLPHLRMFASPSEQPSRLYPEVSVLLQVRIKDDCHVGCFSLLLRLLDLQLFLLCQRLFLLPLSVQVIDYGLEVTIFQIFDRVIFSQLLAEFLPKILLENILASIVCPAHGSIHSCNSFLLWGERNDLTIVLHFDSVGFIVGRKNDTIVLQETPFLSLSKGLLIFPPLIDWFNFHFLLGLFWLSLAISFC